MAAGTDIHRLQAFMWNRIWRGRLNVEQMYNDAVKLGYVKSRKLFNDVYTDVKDGYNAKYPDYRADESNSEKKSSVTLTEAQLRNIVAESVNKVLKEGWPHLLPLDGDGESKYYFKNNKKWLRIANKIYHYLGELSQYLGHNGEDEDCENIEQAMSSVEAVINSLENYGE